ncbi:MAG TPA: PfkB family carbohydrate kinase [Armatimonadota bacterium]|jgi:rfaE bifunctional protein kinase chain/domain
MDLDRLEQILGRFPEVSLAVVGDFFLDKYLVIDRQLSEVSIETGLEAFQVVDIRHSPGAAGTVCNNLAALGVGRLYAVGLTGADGQGYELRQGLAARGVLLDYLREYPDFFTPTYTKPMELQPDGSEVEMNRVDIKNRRFLNPKAEAEMILCLREAAQRVKGMLIADQVTEEGYGVVTPGMREALVSVAADNPRLDILVDSRARVAEFRGLMLKPNHHEAEQALTGGHPDVRIDPHQAGQGLSRRSGKPVFVTRGEEGMLVCTGDACTTVPGVPVEGPLDIVGAGDSASAGIMMALASGASLAEASVVGNLVASITVQQLGTTGTATVAQVRERFRQHATRWESI